ncbi:MAG TPA: tetratricopeptide repeat protein [Bryobacteraceae bacterium]|nr:tetratricopeptide repeat protein [Bryobacteraceae bacterium]
MKGFGLSLILFAGVLVNGQDLKKAEELYQHTDYIGSLNLLKTTKSPHAEALGLMGRDHFMLGEYKQAVDCFQRAAALDPAKSEYQHWLGRTWGRRAETASPFTAPMAASKARQYFERAVQLDPGNQEALNDLFDYYLQAPGILGGGLDKATTVAKHIAELDTAEGYFAQAQIADRRKEYDTAEQHLRRAMELAPRQVGRVLDLAKYLAKHGRIQESEAVFQQAERIAPNSPKVMYTRAKTYIEERRNLDLAKSLLQRYIQCSLTPEDPPREEAQKLLKQVSTGV